MSVEDSCWSLTACPLLALFDEEAEDADVVELVLGGGGGGAPLPLDDGYGMLRHDSTRHFKGGYSIDRRFIHEQHYTKIYYSNILSSCMLG